MGSNHAYEDFDSPVVVVKDEEIIQMYADQSQSVFLRKDKKVLIFSQTSALCREIKTFGANGVTLVEKMETIETIIGEHSFLEEWSFEKHCHFDFELKERVFIFLLCMKTKVAHTLRLPKPIFSIIINLAL